MGTISTTSNGPQLGSNVRVAALADGGFVLGWPVFPELGTPENQILTQRYDSQGTAVGGTVQIAGNLSNGSFASSNSSFRITPDAQGGYTVTVGSPAVATVSLVHFDANGTALQVPVPIGSTALLLPLNGRFVLFTSSSSGTVVQFLDAAGNPVGDPAPIASMPFNATELADGSFVAFFNSGATITAQRFDSTGAAIGDILMPATGGVQPGIAPLAGGGFALAWSVPGTERSGDRDVFTQRFIPVNP